jgi:hypothetical protein
MLPDKLPPLSRRARLPLLAAVGLIALLLVGPRLVDAYVNWLWFGEVVGPSCDPALMFPRRHESAGLD